MAASPGPDGAMGSLAAAWERAWFTPASARPLAIVRILTGGVALVLWWSWGADIVEWFGPDGLLPPEALREWRSPWSVSAFDVVASGPAVRALHLVIGAALLCLTVGLATPLSAPAAALGFASLLHRAPVLAGPADDCVAVLLWCLVVGRSGDDLSLDRWLADRRGHPSAAPDFRNRIALSLLLVHAVAITAAALVAQLKADVWWNGTAAWWLAWRDGALVRPAAVYRGSEYLTNLVTHAVTAFEIAFAAGLCHGASRRAAAWIGIVGWPLVGLLAAEPWWGATMAVFALAALLAPPSPAARGG